jgi:predicted PurR-regulated permease PerM
MTKAAGLSLGRLTIVFAGFVIIVAGMKAAASIVVPLLCALFLMVLSLPVLHWLQRRKVPDGLALLLVIGGIVMTVVLVLLALGSSFAGFQDDCAGYGERLQQVYGEAKEWLGGYVDVTDKLDSAIDPQVLMSYVGNAVGQLGGLMSNAFVILLLVAFLLAEANSFGKKLEAGSKDPAATRARLEEIGRGVTKYFSIKTAVSGLTGVLVGIVLAIAGVDYPVLWGFLAFLLNFVPSIGSILAAIPPVLLAIVQPELGAGTAVVVAVFLLAINLVVGTVLEPRFMGRGLDLSSLVVFLSLLFWGWVLGPVGMLLSVPLTATVKIILEAFVEGRPIARLLGSHVEPA